MTDPIADLLARIRNAQTAKHDTVVVPHSKVRQGIVKILYEEGFIGPFKVAGEGTKKEIEMTLRYAPGKKSLISSMIRESRPGRRHYLGYREIRPVRNGIGLAVLSTPKGILTDRQAREEKVGGELLFTIW